MKKNTGFTLIELIITLTLAAILLTIGIPSFQTTLQSNRRVTQVNELISALNIARSEAIKRGNQVFICISNNGTSCVTGSGAWETGWIIFVDNNGNSTLDNNDTIINVHGQFPSSITVRAGSAFSNWIAYLSNGTSRGNGTATTDTDSNRTFRICDSQGVSQARLIVINATGRSTVRGNQSGDSCP